MKKIVIRASVVVLLLLLGHFVTINKVSFKNFGCDVSMDKFRIILGQKKDFDYFKSLPPNTTSNIDLYCSPNTTAHTFKLYLW